MSGKDLHPNMTTKVVKLSNRMAFKRAFLVCMYVCWVWRGFIEASTTLKKHVVLATHTCFLGGFRVSSCKLSVQRGSGHRQGAEREKGVVGGKGGGR